MTIIHGDCLEELKRLDDNSIDAVVTDPPYGLSNTKPAQVANVLKAWVTGDTEVVPAGKGVMGEEWDSFVPPPAVWAECMRVLKPGGHMAVFAGARTQDLMGLSIRLAGFEIRDTLGWICGSGFPKSMDIGKAIDKGQGKNRQRQLEFTEWMRSTGITTREINEATGTNMGGHYLTAASQPAIATADLFDKLRPLLPEVPERIERLVAERTGIEWTDYVKREVTGVHEKPSAANEWSANYKGTKRAGAKERRDIPSTPEAAKWNGWGTTLKPAIEPIILARKPLNGTVAGNVLAHGVGGLNIDACRVGSQVRHNPPVGDLTSIGSSRATPKGEGTIVSGRFPANVLLDEIAAAEVDKQSGNVNGVVGKKKVSGGFNFNIGEHTPQKFTKSSEHIKDSGGASRFFPVFKYQPKASKKERPVIEREDGTKIQHPTVKPLALLEWLVTLIVPPAGTVLDPFAGTGTTLQAAAQKGFNSIGIEQSAEYVELINQRLTDAGLIEGEEEL